MVLFHFESAALKLRESPLTHDQARATGLGGGARRENGLARLSRWPYLRADCMFPLEGHEPVDSPDQLRSRLTAGLSEFMSLSLPESGIGIRGEWPNLEMVRLVLTGARVNAQSPPPFPAAASRIERRFTARQLEVSAHPLHVGTAVQIDLDLAADRAEFSILRDEQDARWLVLSRVNQGSANLALGENQLGRLFSEVAGHLAASHGLQIEVSHFALTQPEANALGIQTTVTARKAFLKGTLDLSGRVRVDDALRLHLSEVACTGHGVIGAMAAPLLQSLLERHQADSIPLLGHAFAELRCERIQFELGNDGALRVVTVLGS